MFEDIKRDIDRAHALINDLCRGEKTWRMTIPLKPDDSDVIFGDLVRDAIRLLKIVEEFQTLKDLYARAWKLMEKGKYFVVVAHDEPYFVDVYKMIRENEKLAGRWSEDDETKFNYAIFRGG